MIMKKSDTKKEFITAFWKLYAEQPIEKISIGQLCRSAGYHRNTFYNHFENIHDLLEQAIDELLSPLKDKISLIRDIRLLLQRDIWVTIFSAFFTRQSSHIEILFKRKSYDLLAEKAKDKIIAHIKEQCKDSGMDFDMTALILEYQISAVFGVMNDWYRKNKVLSEEEIIKKIYYISSKGVFPALKEEMDKGKPKP